MQERKNGKKPLLFPASWSECRDSNLKQRMLRMVAEADFNTRGLEFDTETAKKNKTEKAFALSVLLVRVSRFELEAS